MVQKEPEEGEEQMDIIMLTHRTVEKQIMHRPATYRGAAQHLGQGDAHPA